MRQRERVSDDNDLEQPDTPSEGRAAASLQNVRLEGEALLAAGADAIERALSGDSEKFLRATQQQGGQ